MNYQMNQMLQTTKIKRKRWFLKKYKKAIHWFILMVRNQSLEYSLILISKRRKCSLQNKFYAKSRVNVPSKVIKCKIKGILRSIKIQKKRRKTYQISIKKYSWKINNKKKNNQKINQFNRYKCHQRNLSKRLLKISQLK